MSVTSRRLRSTVILVHGGCGYLAATARQLALLRRAVDRGYDALAAGGSAVDAVEAAIVVLEKSGRFNAGKGSNRQRDGIARMDASLMDGRDLSAGAVASLEGVLTPIRVARCVMRQTPHVLLTGNGARRVAEVNRIATLSSSRSRQQTRAPLKEGDLDWGTVGAVASDVRGHLAAGTSTGGITHMLPGRVGDSALIGAGTYADDLSGAVSMTGIGEGIIRLGLANTIALSLERGLSPYQAGSSALATLLERIGTDAGTIILSSRGRFTLVHTTPYMISGYRTDRATRIATQWHRIVKE